eukprot:CAMPEP_0196825484 /NCGR_PEP_ID=MMETSP1362-20130617/93083_1 /TAXON_ID=163516 /ORGANISM="Leptocylindrus danicus, Strain CCMP1856" /LENGTH=506 /DNA_ID=CAMNT_0042205921 /DNA_START=1 /DNA_END=1521 /DNA_ORIENTATION=+
MVGSNCNENTSGRIIADYSGSKEKIVKVWSGIFFVAYAVHVASIKLMGKTVKQRDFTNSLIVIWGAIWVYLWSNNKLEQCWRWLASISRDEGHVEERSRQQPLPEEKVSRRRYHFLDNLKTFLTALVVTFHVFMVFLDKRDEDLLWPLIIGRGRSGGTLDALIFAFCIICQAFFMSTFFIISGFFAASGYEAKGREAFVRQKIKRLLVPAAVCSYILNPMAENIALVAKGVSMRYLPHPLMVWFLYWLFIFCLVYSTFADRPKANSEDSSNIKPKDDIPSTRTRMLYGLSFFGIATLFVVLFFGGRPFYGLPTGLVAVHAYILMFSLGAKAYRNQWFDGKSITYRLDIPVSLIYAFVLIEVICVGYLSTFATRPVVFPNAVFLFAFCGVYNADMNMALLAFFQIHMNKTTSLLKSLSKAAYAVFLIHPFVIVLLTSLYIRFYQVFVDEQFFIMNICGVEDEVCMSESDLSDNGVIAGIVFVLFPTHLISWALGSWLCRLPILREYI